MRVEQLPVQPLARQAPPAALTQDIQDRFGALHYACLQFVRYPHHLAPLGRPPARFPQVRVLFRRPPAERRMRFSPHVALQCPFREACRPGNPVVDSVVAVAADDQGLATA